MIPANALLVLMKNNYGNFVIHKALVVAENELKANLIMKIKESMASLSNKKLKARWMQIIEDCEKPYSKETLSQQDPLHNIRKPFEEGEDFISEV